MWKSIINDEPVEIIEDLETGQPRTNPRWSEWLEAVAQEPWLVAMYSLVRWSGTWVGTEEELIEEVRLRVGPEVRASEDFPSTYQGLLDYYMALFYCAPHVPPTLLDYRELEKRDIEDHDVPGWGPESPIMIHRDSAAVRPVYRITVYSLMGRYHSPLALAILEFTHGSRKFTKKERTWSGTTAALAESLLAHFLPPGHFRILEITGTPDDPEGRGAEQRFDETRKLLSLQEPSDYRKLAGRLRTCAYMLRDYGVEMSWKKMPATSRGAYGTKQSTQKLYWTVRAPRWR